MCDTGCIGSEGGRRHRFVSHALTRVASKTVRAMRLSRDTDGLPPSSSSACRVRPLPRPGVYRARPSRSHCMDGGPAREVSARREESSARDQKGILTNDRGSADWGPKATCAFYVVGIAAVTVALFTNRAEVGRQFAADHGLPALAGAPAILLTIAMGVPVVADISSMRLWGWWLVMTHMAFLLHHPASRPRR